MSLTSGKDTRVRIKFTGADHRVPLRDRLPQRAEDVTVRLTAEAVGAAGPGHTVHRDRRALGRGLWPVLRVRVWRLERSLLQRSVQSQTIAAAKIRIQILSDFQANPFPSPSAFFLLYLILLTKSVSYETKHVYLNKNVIRP